MRLVCSMAAYDAQESSDGRTVFFTSKGAGIWKTPTAADQPEPVQGLVILLGSAGRCLRSAHS